MKSGIALVTVAGAAVAALGAGCAHVKVDPIEVQTIHIVHDVNINVDKTLEDFFAFQEQQAASTKAASTQSTTQTVAAPPAPAAAAAGDLK